MKKYEVLKNCVIEGSDFSIGDTVELEEPIAVGLLAAGQVAEQVGETEKTDRSVGLDSSDTKPVKKRSKKK
ncbi:MAG: hypothetical protein Unbinned4234contig1002_6 [Prokaryotic dsDNA virus sp.]|jgi:hypothetical protein|nr:MAG: hypothetical protein Unbinned4234contig1002_6 [Prokaryotic dsDNA virus sp.]|tara:strand:- start:18263 stop:18475 length:213 start_codon:yes stop_codon:yes gene_type:complete